MLRPALLFYRKLVKDLEEYGFEINPYDPCIANKTVLYESEVAIVGRDGRTLKEKDRTAKTQKITEKKQSFRVIWPRSTDQN